MLCANAPPYDLFQALAGTLQAGGTWTCGATGALTGQFVDPGRSACWRLRLRLSDARGAAVLRTWPTVSVVDPTWGSVMASQQAHGPVRRGWDGFLKLNNGRHLWSLTCTATAV